MRKPSGNIKVSFILLVFLMQTTPSHAYYVIFDDVDNAQNQGGAKVASIDNKTNPPPLEPINPEPTKLVQAGTANKVQRKKKIVTALKNPVTRCPSEVLCSTSETKPVNYPIGFAKSKAEISTNIKNKLSALLPRMKGNKVCIIGRPDLVQYSDGYSSKLAINRAYNIRKYLLANGVPATSITTTAKTEPYTSDDGSTFSSDLIVIEKNSTIEKRKVNMPNINVSSHFTNVSSVKVEDLRKENAKVVLIDGDNETINLIDASIRNGNLKEKTGNQIKEMIKFNEIRVLKNISNNRAI